MGNKKIINYIDLCFCKLNRKLKSEKKHVKKWVLIKKDFSIFGDEFTATMKLRRKIVDAKYRDLIENIYDEPKL